MLLNSFFFPHAVVLVGQFYYGLWNLILLIDYSFFLYQGFNTTLNYLSNLWPGVW